MSNSPLISVIVPAYNVEAYIQDALDSIFRQSLHRIEIIAINDGSTDNTHNILCSLAEKDSRLHVISHENRGVGAARNEGIAAASGEYIAFLDPDDRYPSLHTLEMLYSKAVEHQIDICGGELQVFSSSSPVPHQNFGAVVDGFCFSREGIIPYEDYQFDYGFYRFIYRRKLLVENGITFPQYQRFQDPPFMVRAFLAAGKFYAVPEPTYSFRVEHKSIVWDSQKIDGLYKGIQDIWRLACKHQLPRLKYYVWQRIRGHYPATCQRLTPEQLLFIHEVETFMNPQRKTLAYKIFSKDKNFAHPRRRRLSILGITYNYGKCE